MGASQPTSSAAWYEDGLVFGCTACGSCCSGAPGFVWVSQEEQSTIAAQLGLDQEVFARTFTRLVGDRVSLVERPGGDCVFLDDDGRCTIHANKPRQCVTYPFWPRLVATKEAWQLEAPRCPGMTSGEGHRFSAAEIDALLDKTTPRTTIQAIMREQS